MRCIDGWVGTTTGAWANSHHRVTKLTAPTTHDRPELAFVLSVLRVSVLREFGVQLQRKRLIISSCKRAPLGIHLLVGVFFIELFDVLWHQYQRPRPSLHGSLKYCRCLSWAAGGCPMKAEQILQKLAQALRGNFSILITTVSRRLAATYGLHCSSFWGIPYTILNM